jgi:ubiquinone/menaquinone biosynthesis C-methylase UbiE
MEWWEEYFDEDMGKILFPQERMRQTSPECDLIEDLLELHKGDAVLDLACGIGRHSVELGKRGYEVTGLDYSEVYLSKAREAARKRKVEVEFLKGDMRKIPFKDRFDAVICMFTSFGFFKKESDHLKVLRGVARCLRPGGKLLLDVVSRQFLEAHFKARDWTQHEDGLIILEDQWLDKEHGRSVSTWTMIDGKKRRTFAHTLRLYTLPELTKLAARASLGLIKDYGGYANEPVGPDGRRLVAVFRRP